MFSLNLIDFFKEKRKKLLDTSNKVNPNIEQPKEPNIEIVIENATNIFENEQEIIRQGGKEFLENGIVDSLEDGIITCATMIRGLKYRRTEKDDDGNIKIILRDISLDNTHPKSL